MVIVTVSPGEGVKVRSPALLVAVEELMRAAVTEPRTRIVKEVFGPFYEGGVDSATMNDLSPDDFAELGLMIRERYAAFQDGDTPAKPSDAWREDILCRFRRLIEAMDRDPRSSQKESMHEKSTAEPDATDNPDDAQRLREDH